jgi:hypothetical protein
MSAEPSRMKLESSAPRVCHDGQPHVAALKLACEPALLRQVKAKLAHNRATDPLSESRS